MKKIDNSFNILMDDIRQLINSSRQHIAQVVNNELPLLYWHIGARIKTDVLGNKRAEYGKRVIKNVAEKLTLEYGSGWSAKHLLHCLRIAETFSKDQIVSAVQRQLSWTHLKTLTYLSDDIKREFYLEMAIVEKWNTRDLAEKIDSLLYERTAISRKPDQLIKKGLKLIKNKNELTPDFVFRSVYFLNFLGLKDVYSEKDLEASILLEIQKFINELGTDFAFLARQKRISVDGIDYHIDLLFYHRSLCRLVVVELKLGKFKPEHEGQMLLYLRWLDKNERKENENSPIGLILCSEGNTEHIEYLMLEDGNIKVAQYLTKLPDKKLLKLHLHKAIEAAKQRMEETHNA